MCNMKSSNFCLLGAHLLELFISKIGRRSWRQQSLESYVKTSFLLKLVQNCVFHLPSVTCAELFFLKLEENCVRNA